MLCGVVNESRCRRGRRRGRRGEMLGLEVEQLVEVLLQLEELFGSWPSGEGVGEIEDRAQPGLALDGVLVHGDGFGLVAWQPLADRGG